MRAWGVLCFLAGVTVAQEPQLRDPDGAPRSLQAIAFERVVANGNQDVEEQGGTINFDSDDLDLGNSAIIGGLRFQNVQIPQDAIIETAAISGIARRSSIGEAPILVEITGERTGNAGAFSDANLISARPRTTKVDWVLGDVTQGQPLVTVDISQVVQEIVNLNAWRPSNAMVFAFDTPVRGSGRNFGTVEFSPDNEDRHPTLTVVFSEQTSNPTLSPTRKPTEEDFVDITETPDDNDVEDPDENEQEEDEQNLVPAIIGGITASVFLAALLVFGKRRTSGSVIKARTGTFDNGGASLYKGTDGTTQSHPLSSIGFKSSGGSFAEGHASSSVSQAGAYSPPLGRPTSPGRQRRPVSPPASPRGAYSPPMGRPTSPGRLRGPALTPSNANGSAFGIQARFAPVSLPPRTPRSPKLERPGEVPMSEV
mmetsp:Transcript_5165/g.9722  ORF Transcript_5165/g.9722 Transcript_5165/m.9722 type:complete len:425 (+) Transcript_5165:270-1544(+)